MQLLSLTKNRLPFLITLIFGIELTIYLWAVWTSTFDKGNFFAIEPAFIFDKCARIAGRISSVLILLNLLMVGHFGLNKLYSEEKKKESFLVLITLFTINHLIHLLFVFLRFRSHGEVIQLDGPMHIGGNMHGFITFISIIIIPVILWKYKNQNKFLHFVIILYLFNISGFIMKTFSGKVVPPDHPAYHNQFGIAVLTIACLYVLYRAFFDKKRNVPAH